MMHSVNYTRVKSHYHSLLSQHYTWTFGGSNKQSNNYKVLSQYLQDGQGKVAVDLGCGSGFQSVPLMQLGYHVFCVDSSTQLLEELQEHAPTKNYTLVETDMLSYKHKADVVVCMGDSITHLANLDEVELLLRNVYDMLDGLFFISFRDLTVEMFDCDRYVIFISNHVIFGCFASIPD
ncbi:hypothetical protein HDV01_002286 [Terramyces sp. JEL0728]|nr:hypothetical protein HDV01_002286 [Terramyces sp. JEL0728]